MLEHRARKGREVAAKASRELAKHAGRFDHDTQVEADICPEIEWAAHQIRHPDDDEEDKRIEPRSPLVHPAMVAADFANDG